MIKKFKEVILAQLSQGLSADAITRAILVGASISVFPLLGFTTPLCLFFAARLRLSHVVVQGVNYLMTPAQLALIPVFIWIGQKILGWNEVSVSPVQILGEWRKLPFVEFLGQYGKLGVAGVLAWALIVPLVAWMAEKGVKKWVLKLQS